MASFEEMDVDKNGKISLQVSNLADISKSILVNLSNAMLRNLVRN